MSDFEKLGAFYLGKTFDMDGGGVRDEPVMYDAKDLTTHAMCVGMTGSGKTGLCMALLEEAAIDGIPSIVIDPKGDIGNLMLTFPELRAQDFQPWIDPNEALRKGLDPEAYAEKTASTWKKGLADWGQDGARIRTLRKAVDIAIYTPGSNAGLQVSVIKSFSAPDPAMRSDVDAMRDRIQSAVSGLLALLGIEADPLQSREHILLSNILQYHWQKGADLTLPEIIGQIQAPPFAKLGVFDLEVFYPAKDRLALAMRLNNALASPGFSAWMEGEPLDIQRMLFTPEGKPRCTIMSISHLPDSERMFFVTILLNELLSWMRSQSGTSSLRALLYMDEIYGYFPPNANPPSKRPMLTLLKQARAFGVGCVLATQNPVDLDYKGLGNTGTWFIGRLQAERDKLRLLDGLEGATASAGQSFDRSRMETLLSSLGSRVFLMNNVHDNEPVVFHTRWVMSYLRGPLSRSQVETLMRSRKKAAAALPSATRPEAPRAMQGQIVAVPAPAATSRAAAPEKPSVPTGIKQVYLPATDEVKSGCRLVYRPALMAEARMHFVRVSVKVDDWFTLHLMAAPPEDSDGVLWDEATYYDDTPPATHRRGDPEATYSELPMVAARAKSYESWSKSLKDHLYQNRSMTIYTCKALKSLSEPGESEGDFRVRLRQAAHEARDLAMEKLRKKHAPKLASLNERIRKADAKIDVEREQYKQHGLQTVISLGTTVLGALLGRKAFSSTTMTRTASTMRRAGRRGSAKEDVRRAEDSLVSLQEKLETMEADFTRELDALKNDFEADNFTLDEVVLRPRKSDLKVKALQLAWTPWQVDANGIAEPLF
jgi:hypothetical protein